jgi:hypothetical protein
LSNAHGLAFNASGDLFASNYTGSIQEFSPTGAYLGAFASGLGHMEDLVFAPTSVPEPSSLILGLIGLGLAGGPVAFKRRRS